MEEILNIDYHRKILIIKALNRSKTRVIAARRLGVTKRTLCRYIKQYDIRFEKQNLIYSLPPQVDERVINEAHLNYEVSKILLRKHLQYQKLNR